MCNHICKLNLPTGIRRYTSHPSLQELAIARLSIKSSLQYSKTQPRPELSMWPTLHCNTDIESLSALEHLRSSSARVDFQLVATHCSKYRLCRIQTNIRNRNRQSHRWPIQLCI